MQIWGVPGRGGYNILAVDNLQAAFIDLNAI